MTRITKESAGDRSPAERTISLGDTLVRAEAVSSTEEAPFTVAPMTTASGDADKQAFVGIRKAYRMFVGGAFVRSESGRYWQVAESASEPESDNDAQGGSRENIPLASSKDGSDAALAAKNAWAGWAGRSAYTRGQILYRMAEMLHARTAELERSLERGGVPARQAAREVAATIDRTISYAGWTDKYQSLLSSLSPLGQPHFNFTVPEPVGVVVIVAPGRPALLGLAGAILPAVASGNTCVVLASEADPRTAVTFCEALATCDLPGGVVNVLTGRVAEVLPHLAGHLDVAALDLHGVDAALAKSAEHAAVGAMKRVSARALTEEAWFDSTRTESPRWIERFVQMKTVWHPSGV